MKGHAKIELTEVSTGKKKVIEHNNMITNALSEYVKPVGFTGYTPLQYCKNFGMFNILFGGLFLFDSAIEEDANIMYLPKGIKCVGRGSDIAYSGADTSLGTFNSVESGFDENGDYKMVWDFTTSQANGTIAALSLTSEHAGRIGLYCDAYVTDIGNPKQSFMSSNTYTPMKQTAKNYYYESIAFIDGDYVYFPRYYNFMWNAYYADTHMKNTGSLSLVRVKMPVNNIVYSNAVYSSDTDFREEIIDIPLPTDIMEKITIVQNVAGSISFDGRYMYVFLSQQNTSIAADEEIKILKVDFRNNFSTEVISFKNTTNDALHIWSYKNGFHGYANPVFMVDGYFVCANSSRNKLYRIKMSDPTDVAEINMEGSPNWQTGNVIKFIGKICEGILVVLNGQYAHAIDLDSWTCKSSLLRSNCDVGYVTIATISEDYSKILYSNKTYFGIEKNPFYLATINNLTEPVIKTSAHTMKITYTLTEE